MERFSILEINVKDFRVIKEAYIKLDGITVVAGENSSGKSTLSKLLYYAVEISNHYDELIKEKLNDKIRDIIFLLEDVTRRNIKDEKYRDTYSDWRHKFHRDLSDRKKNIFDQKEKILQCIDDLEKHVGDLKDEKFKSHRLHRINHIMANDFNVEYKGDKNLDNFFPTIKEITNKLFNKANTEIRERSKKLFDIKLNNIFEQKLKDFSIKEYGEYIVQEQNKKLDHFKTIDSIIYMDSPMTVEHPRYNYNREKNLDIDNFSHWENLNFYLKQKNKKVLEEIKDTPVYNEIQGLFSSQQVLDGKVVLDEKKDELSFHRNDGQRFKVADCAMGIKAIATLQTLYNNGWLTHKTLLVLDEPEVHLHPQWIVEYVRLIVLLNKKIKVKFFILTHNPDMISGIKDIFNNEKLDNKMPQNTLRFYLTQKQKDYTYKFVDKGVDVEDIFASFNIAIDKLNEYGGEDE